MAEVREDLKKIKEELVNRKYYLEQAMTGAHQERFADEQVQDAADQALSSTIDSLNESFNDAAREEYNRIIQALSMIEEGTYGICVDCQLPISDRRLKSYPNATRCLACQELFEENGFHDN